MWPLPRRVGARRLWAGGEAIWEDGAEIKKQGLEDAAYR